jgi:hypothetical protein
MAVLQRGEVYRPKSSRVELATVGRRVIPVVDVGSVMLAGFIPLSLEHMFG